MRSKATTVADYLDALPPDRKAALSAIRSVILKNLDEDIEEGMSYGMIGYAVPHRVFPAGYHCDPKQPLPYGGLASQKNHMSLYLMSLYAGGAHERWFADAWKKTGRKLDMGKCCIRFRKLDDVPLDVVAEAIRRVPAKAYVAHYEASIRTMNEAAAKKAAAPASRAKKVPAKAAPAKKGRVAAAARAKRR
jgi:hypothetical protein